MTALSTLTLVATDDRPAVEARLTADGHHLLHLDGATVTDVASFLARAGPDLGFPGPVRTWSGFDDYLWGVVADADADAVAIIWSDAHRMLGGGLGDLLLVVEAITDLARQVADGSESGFPRPVTLRLVLVGDGPDFPPLADG